MRSKQNTEYSRACHNSGIRAMRTFGPRKRSEAPGLPGQPTLIHHLATSASRSQPLPALQNTDPPTSGRPQHQHQPQPQPQPQPLVLWVYISAFGPYYPTLRPHSSQHVTYTYGYDRCQATDPRFSIPISYRHC